MFPILFKFGFIQVYSYGLMVALAFWACAFLLSKQARSLGMEKDFFLEYVGLAPPGRHLRREIVIYNF